MTNRYREWLITRPISKARASLSASSNIFSRLLDGFTLDCSDSLGILLMAAHRCGGSAIVIYRLGRGHHRCGARVAA